MESIMHHFLSWLNPATIDQLQTSQDLTYVLDDNELETVPGGCKTVDDEFDNNQAFTGNPKERSLFPPLF